MTITVGTRWDSKGFVDFIVYGPDGEYTTTSLVVALKKAGEWAEQHGRDIKIYAECVGKLKELV